VEIRRKGRPEWLLFVRFLEYFGREGRPERLLFG